MLHRIATFAALTLAAIAQADIPATLFVDPGSTAVVNLELTITGPDGSETQSNSAVVPLNGNGSTRFTPNFEPFNGQILEAVSLQPGNCTLAYDFFCGPLFGCITITIELSNLSLTLQQEAGASIVNGQVGWGAPWRLQGNYNLSSILFNSTGAIDTISVIGLNGNLSVGNGGWRLDQMLLGSIVSDVPADSLPAGISVRTNTSLGLGGAALVGNYTPPPPAACGNPGFCNTVHATPGCDLVGCCSTVCAADPTCCVESWDANCVQIAVASCIIPPNNDLCSAAESLPLGRFPFTTVNADTDGQGLPSSCYDTDTAGQFVSDVWFTHTTAVNNGIIVSTCGHAGFDTRIAVYTQCGGSLLACSDDGPGCPGGTSRCIFYGVAGETYLFRVGGKFGQGVGEIDISWGDIDPPQTTLSPGWSAKQGGNGHHYAVYGLGVGATWNDAIAVAEQLGGHALTLASVEESNFVMRLAPPPSVGDATALGLRQDKGAAEPLGGWNWVTNEPITYVAWAPGEPNDAGAAGEDFAMLRTDGLWNDIQSGVEYVIVEFDSDPMLEEIEDASTGTRYRAVLSPIALTWSQAAAQAESLGGRLASLETPEEAQFVFDGLVRYTALWSNTVYNGGPWVGLRDIGGVWTWESGKPLAWNPWQPGEPNGTGGVASFYAFNRGPQSGLDDTFDGNQRRGFIVEFAPAPGNPADLDGDGAVGGADLAIMLGAWGACQTTPCSADLDGDGVVGGADLAILLGAWGPLGG